MEIEIIEKVKREDMNYVEEDMGYKKIIDNNEYKKNDMEKVIGKRRRNVEKKLRMLKMKKRVKDFIVDGELYDGNERRIIKKENKKEIEERIVKEGI